MTRSCRSHVFLQRFVLGFLQFDLRRVRTHQRRASCSSRSRRLPMLNNVRSALARCASSTRAASVPPHPSAVRCPLTASSAAACASSTRAGALLCFQPAIRRARHVRRQASTVRASARSSASAFSACARHCCCSTRWPTRCSMSRCVSRRCRSSVSSRHLGIGGEQLALCRVPRRSKQNALAGFQTGLPVRAGRPSALRDHSWRARRHAPPLAFRLGIVALQQPQQLLLARVSSLLNSWYWRATAACASRRSICAVSSTRMSSIRVRFSACRRSGPRFPCGAPCSA